MSPITVASDSTGRQPRGSIPIRRQAADGNTFTAVAHSPAIPPSDPEGSGRQRHSAQQAVHLCDVPAAAEVLTALR